MPVFNRHAEDRQGRVPDWRAGERAGGARAASVDAAARLCMAPMEGAGGATSAPPRQRPTQSSSPSRGTWHSGALATS
eukprot:8990693-Pyramimonas_sp.AAC.1